MGWPSLPPVGPINSFLTSSPGSPSPKAANEDDDDSLEGGSDNEGDMIPGTRSNIAVDSPVPQPRASSENRPIESQMEDDGWFGKERGAQLNQSAQTINISSSAFVSLISYKMAEIILIPVAKQILGKATDLASEQFGLLWNFKRELLKLKDTIGTIQAVLRDAEEKQFHSNQVKDWLEKLSEVMYDAEDLLDDLATEARRKVVLAATSTGNDDGGGRRTLGTTCWSVVCFLLSSLPKQLAYDLKMAHGIKAIREKLDDISKDKDTLHLEVHTTEEEPLPSRETDSCPPTIVVGREDDKKNIIELLLNSNREANISVVPIVGMGGLGKTTLAQLVSDDDRVKGHFDIKAWVYVSQSFDVKVILGKMLRSMNCGSQAGVDLDVLQTRVREAIKGKRFLFVLDDVWEETDRSWETLGKYLMFGAAGSKVLVTTRSTKVAEVGGGALKSRTSTIIVVPYNLKGLSEEESWNLLVEKAFPRKVPQESQLQKIGKKILRKCDGVPLAVSTIAAVLVDFKDPKFEWPSFLQNGLSSITKEGEDDPTMSALKLGFNHLPSHMKHCFAYCKFFSKGEELRINLLVQLWVAQGYIESEDKVAKRSGGISNDKTVGAELEELKGLNALCGELAIKSLANAESPRTVRKPVLRTGYSITLSYGRLSPTNSLDFVHSGQCLHWLSQVPPELSDKRDPLINKGKVFISRTSSPAVIGAYKSQYRKDFCSFLQARSEVVVSDVGAEIEREGSFAVDRLETIVIPWDGCNGGETMCGSLTGRPQLGTGKILSLTGQCLHWLSQVPPELSDKRDPLINKGKVFISRTSSPAVIGAYKSQYRKDFCSFLQARSEVRTSPLSRALELEVEGPIQFMGPGADDVNHTLLLELGLVAA
ncbi:unnamed protein product [Linum tenue]|uniref:Disease resistance RPP13-like protein 1 n=1 Tax=Linum tenue TaxID=586396 RepID=A0AAV0RBN6_9ROSI|nr:unnamed protein product [Linum tenue]